MSREQRIIEAFVSLTDTFGDEVDPLVLVHRLVETSVQLTAADAAGVMLGTARGQLRSVAVSDHRAGLLELFQNQTDQGPCIDCWRTGERLSAPDFSRRQNEWPYFVPLARAAGFEGAYAIPLRIRRRTVGALNLLTSAPAPLPAEELDLMQALGDVTVTALMQWNGDPLRPEDILTRTQAAVSAKATVDMAAGMIAASAGLSVPRAAMALHDYSHQHSRRPTDVARALISREMPAASVLAASGQSD